MIADTHLPQTGATEAPQAPGTDAPAAASSRRLASARRDDPPPLIIRPQSGWRLIEPVELWRYRDLLWMLALRDIKVRYKQTIIGAAWAVLQPLATMLVFYALFALLGAKAVSAGVPYAVSAYGALLVWQLFSTSLTQSSNSLVDQQALIKKVYFPRLIYPLAPILAALLDFAISMVLLVVLMAWYSVGLHWTAAVLPLLLVMVVTTALSVGLWFSALSAMYRDFRYVVPFVAQLWLYVTPVLYETASVVPQRWRLWYFFNPMAGIVEGFRWALFGIGSLPIAHLAVSMAAVAVLLATGLIYFRRVEDTLADWV
jgi:lipopolysaccharide transport system permease protein